jgi:hypothetical protein
MTLDPHRKKVIKLIKEIAQEKSPTGMKFQSSAIKALQEAAKIYNSQFFEGAKLCAILSKSKKYPQTREKPDRNVKKKKKLEALVTKLRTCEAIKTMMADANPKSVKIYVISEDNKPQKYLIKDSYLPVEVKGKTREMKVDSNSINFSEVPRKQLNCEITSYPNSFDFIEELLSNYGKLTGVFLANQIFSYLDFSSLQQVRLVCKSWNFFLIKDRKMWIKILKRTQPYLEYLSNNLSMYLNY